ncbi:MAG: hypothetical protein P4L84_19620 [Isosphaeraceae bacterium]|nr:hypothetical protein [Isosphaeraceae bacterium]
MDEYEPPIEPTEPVKQPRGCLFYGCVTAVCVSLVVLVLIGLAAFSTYRYYTRMVQQYTSTTPMELPKVELPAAEAEALDARVDAFKKSLDTGKDVKPLVLTADEINALIAKNPEFKNRLHVEIPGDKIQGQISLPLDEIKLPGLKGRYLNGKASFAVMLTNGKLFVTLDALEVNGKPVSDDALGSFRTQNLAAGYADNPENAAAIRKLESIEVKDGKLIIMPRAKADEEAEKSEQPEEPKKTPKPDEAPAAKEEPKGDDGAKPKDEKAEPKAA